MKITTKRTGLDEIKKAKDNGEDIAVLSTIYNLDSKTKPERFSCALGRQCLMGDPKTIEQGTPFTHKKKKILRKINTCILNY